jgi:MFS transporter, YNFM family, putative membrane transport protein
MATTDSLVSNLPVDDRRHATGAWRRTLLIGLIGFLTLVDLFAAQAILPTLVAHYGVTPSAMGVAVNASTMGMAISGLVVALFSRRIDRKRGIWLSLALLSIPTTLLAFAPDLATFAALRVTQGVFMAGAFTLTMTYLAEQCSAEDTAGALAAYITGGVASNLVGRLISGSVADMFGLAANFYIFAALNLAGAVLVFLALRATQPMATVGPATRAAFASWAAHLRNGPLRASFAIGFLILFAFIGTFTYANFVLAADPLALSPMMLGVVYLVFLPSMFTTPLAGKVALRLGTRATFWGSLAVAGAGLPLLLFPSLVPVLAGLALVGVGTFFAQATATGFVGRAAKSDRAAASGIYLSCYYLGGLVGAAVLGQLFDRYGWEACVAGIGAALAIAAIVAFRLKMTGAGDAR